MALEEYKRKRDFKQTPEPPPKLGKPGQRRFVVQKHRATRLHYDFRLEMDGVLKSWAVPKGPSLDPTLKHLAAFVEDHPVEYGSFEGQIPKGQYGAGAVEIWDHGTYELLEEKPDGGLTVRLHGNRFQGVWTLVPAHLDGKEQNWLLIRVADKADDAATEQAVSERAYAPMLASPHEGLPAADG